MTDILVTENITGGAMDALRSECDVRFDPELWNDTDRLTETVRSVRALIVRNQTQVTADLIAAAPKLEIISRAGAGLDNIDTDAATEAGIVVSYAPHENAVSVAELTIGFMLALARRIPAADADTHGGGWNRHEFTGIELSGKTLGIVGFGQIGQLVAERARVFGMQIVTHDPFVEPASDVLTQFNAQWLELDDLLRRSDIVTVHVPLTNDTAGLFNAEQFGQMKSSALLINTSRGEIIDEEALAQALTEKRIAGVALDVRQSEPPKPGPLEQMKNVICTPHIAAFTREAQQRVVAVVCRDVITVLSGGEACNVFTK
jgi:D-3-phosphoglycerate dehydrogenase